IVTPGRAVLVAVEFRHGRVIDERERPVVIVVVEVVPLGRERRTDEQVEPPIVVVVSPGPVPVVCGDGDDVAGGDLGERLAAAGRRRVRHGPARRLVVPEHGPAWRPAGPARAALCAPGLAHRELVPNLRLAVLAARGEGLRADEAGART